MPHCDTDALALASLGEPLPGRQAAHVARCGACSAEVAAFATVVAAVRVRIPDGPDVAPPAEVWTRVAEATGLRAAAPQPTPVRDARRPRRPRPRGDARTRSWGTRAVLAVAAASLVVGGAGGAALTRAVPSSADRGTVVAAPLAGLPLAPDAQGAARVVRTGSGARDLVVDVSRLGDRSGTFYEVWLIDTSVQRMVPLGILRGSEGRFVIPAGVDLGQYPVVDVSVQTPGSPEHSGDSVLRGTLPA